MELKSQDTLLALKYWSMARNGGMDSIRIISDSIGISAGEISKGTKRLVAAKLLVKREDRYFTESGALLEWLCYGVRYAYPAQSIGYGRGMPTAWNCTILKSEVMPPMPAHVWQQAGGEAEGVLVEPFHASVPYAAARDKLLYEVLSLTEAIRLGKPRELAIARAMLVEKIK